MVNQPSYNPNNSDFDTGQELRRPPSTAYHLNHYQHGQLFPDLFLDGGPVPDSCPRRVDALPKQLRRPE